ncbi:MAG: FAD-binding protein [Acidobacteriota bacterium]|nr:FAD-binding protein [Acidobacteriota bacterium]
MDKARIMIGDTQFPVFSLNTLIIGSGAAALNAACSLHDLGVRDIAVVTEKWGGGTSNESGSDKQTYYKLSLAGDIPDSPCQMAEDLFAGGSMHGDIALVEAQNSLQAFFHLIGLGVPFPHDRYGAYVGYKTDHDPRQRATSAGPLTSHWMFKVLAREVRKKKIPVLDRHQVIALLTGGRAGGKKVIGAVALDARNLDSPSRGFVLFNAVNIILGTGGPAAMYKNTVYPPSQSGSHGMAFAAGALGNNLTESQFGLASLGFRWNLSGTYQQVIPRYFSTDRDGADPREFLNAYFPDMGTLASAIFLKGYQWPFDPRKASGYGSSLIDILVHRETVENGRRVFLDFRGNPSGAGALEDFSFECLSPEALAYLRKSGALLPTPIERLRRMNPPAIEIFRSHGIDLEREPLEIAVCAQHNNGGLKGNIWWESNVRHLFPVGEANGSHGVYRPGGSALNSGQVGSRRAALFISRRYPEKPPAAGDFLREAETQIRAHFDRAARMVDGTGSRPGILSEALSEIQNRMSSHAGPIRNRTDIGREARKARELFDGLRTSLKVGSAQDLPGAFKVLDACLTHVVYLEAIQEYLRKEGKSRGSYIVTGEEGEIPCPGLEEKWKFSPTPPEAYVSRRILEVGWNDRGGILKRWVPIRPIPREESWFENVWGRYLKDEIVDRRPDSSKRPEKTKGGLK